MTLHKNQCISVIMRVGGRPPFFLRRALASVQAQVYPVEEIILVPVGDEGRLVVEAILPELKDVSVITCAVVPWGSPGAALNKGVRAARGRWLAFLDDDDTWCPGFLKRVEEELTRCGDGPAFGGVVVRTETVSELFAGDAVSVKKRKPYNPQLTTIDLAALSVRNQFTINALVVSRKVFDVTGFYREDLSVLEDWEFNVRTVSKFHFEVIPELLVSYHLRPKDGAVANTSINEHVRVAAVIRNEWIRADLAAGRLGMGQLALAGEARGLSAVLGLMVYWRAKIRAWLGNRT